MNKKYKFRKKNDMMNIWNIDMKIAKTSTNFTIKIIQIDVIMNMIGGFSTTL